MQRKEIAQEVAALCDRWLTPGVHARLSRTDQQRIAALGDIHRLVRLAQIEGAAVSRRLTGLRWEANRLVVTGRCAGLDGMPEHVGVALVLRARNGRGQELIVPAEREGAAFVARRRRGGARLRHLGPAGGRRDGGRGPLRPARRRPRRLRHPAGAPAHRRRGGPAVLHQGQRQPQHRRRRSPDGVPGRARFHRTRWTLGRRLVIDGEVTVVGAPPAASAITPAGLARAAVRARTGRAGGRAAGRRVRGPARDGQVRAGHLGRLSGGRAGRAARAGSGSRRRPDRRRAAPAVGQVARRAMRRSVRPYATSGKGRLSTVVLKMTALLRPSGRILALIAIYVQVQADVLK